MKILPDNRKYMGKSSNHQLLKVPYIVGIPPPHHCYCSKHSCQLEQLPDYSQSMKYEQTIVNAGEQLLL